jgi:cyclopropane fatty-acyl-phospholipid synthase-like methyltransferase
MGSELTYSRAVFDVPSEQAARRIILTPEGGEGTDERWERETPHLVDLIGEHLRPPPDALYIDYGCGIGRLAKAMIERFDCRVLGVDISQSMRALAPNYVGSQNFSAISPHMLHTMVGGGLRVDGALSVWVLQHVLDPVLDISLIQRSLSPRASLFVVNLLVRAVPTAEGKWANDGKDIAALLDGCFERTATGTLSADAVPQGTADTTFWGAYRPRTA